MRENLNDLNAREEWNRELEVTPNVGSQQKNNIIAEKEKWNQNWATNTLKTILKFTNLWNEQKKRSFLNIEYSYWITRKHCFDSTENWLNRKIRINARKVC